MLNQLCAAWRGRRTLLISDAHRLSFFMEILLEQLGAKPARIAPGASPCQLSRALTQGRISAVILPDTSSPGCGKSLPDRLKALLILYDEIREAGVPLVLMCSDTDVYRSAEHPWSPDERAPIGGQTREGLIQSILQLAADGASRALLGDAVHTIIVRHAPYLGSRHPSIMPYESWMEALETAQPLPVSMPVQQGVFLHPLDICGGALALGARYLLGDRNLGGAYNLGVGAHNLMANRTAALRLIRRCGGTRPIQEQTAPAFPQALIPDGAKARLLCGAKTYIPGDDSLEQFFALYLAEKKGHAAAIDVIHKQVSAYLNALF